MSANNYLKSSIALAILSDLVHIFLGGMDVAAPLTEPGLLEPEVAALNLAIWHYSSLILLTSTCFLIGAAKPSILPEAFQPHAIALAYVGVWQWAACGLCVLFVPWWYEGLLFAAQLPQPWALALITLLALKGLKGQGANDPRSYNYL